MNERLKALMLEAGYAAPDLATRAHVLAELIVAECTRCMTESTIQLGKSFDKTMVPWLLQDLSKQIRQHFGVEE